MAKNMLLNSLINQPVLDAPDYCFYLPGKRQVHVYYSSLNKIDFYLYQNKGFLNHQKIQNVVLPSISYPCDSNQMVSFFSHCYPQLISLSDGSNKLYLHLKILGGADHNPDANPPPPPETVLVNIQEIINSEPEMTNTRLSDLVKRNIPPQTYTSVHVAECNYKFDGATSTPSRRITLRPNVLALQWLKDLWSFFFGKRYPLTETFNANEVQNYVLEGVYTNEALNSIIKAFKEKRRIFIVVSKDGNSLDCYLEDSESSRCIIN